MKPWLTFLCAGLIAGGPSKAAAQVADSSKVSHPPARRAHAIAYSDAYGTRAAIHRYASYTTLPLFALEYAAGEQLLRNGSAAPSWARDVHKPASYALEALFAVNTVTGVWNLWDSRRNPAGRKRSFAHGVLMLAADVGFAYAPSLAPSTAKVDARIAAGTRGGWTPHKKVAIASISVASAGYLLMLLKRD